MQGQEHNWVPMAALLAVVVFGLLIWILRRKTLEPRDVMPTMDEDGTSELERSDTNVNSGPSAGGRANSPPGEPPPAPPTLARKCPGCDEEFEPGDGWFSRASEFCPTCEPIMRSVDNEFARRLESERVAFESEQRARIQIWKRVGKLDRVRQIRQAEKERYAEEQRKLEAELTRLRAFRGETR
jgi:hypothetical protein